MSSLKSFTLNPDGRLLELTFDKKVQVLRADELDSLIAQLGQLRSRMEPAVPANSTNVTSAHPVDNFYFRRMGDGANAVPVSAGALFLFQSARFGWFQLPASAELCSGLARWLVNGDPEGAARGANAA